MSSTVGAGIQCPSCGKQYKWKPELAGRRMKCKCGGVIQVPRGQSAADDSALSALADAAADISPPRTESRTCPSCGSPLSTAAVLCVNCGQSLTAGAAGAGGFRMDQPYEPSRTPFGISYTAMVRISNGIRVMFIWLIVYLIAVVVELLNRAVELPPMARGVTALASEAMAFIALALCLAVPVASRTRSYVTASLICRICAVVLVAAALTLYADEDVGLSLIGFAVMLSVTSNVLFIYFLKMLAAYLKDKRLTKLGDRTVGLALLALVLVLLVMVSPFLFELSQMVVLVMLLLVGASQILLIAFYGMLLWEMTELTRQHARSAPEE